jgi:predicted nucleotidyltransferase
MQPNSGKVRPRYEKVMTREQAIKRLREHEAELKRAGVRHLFLFGSTARDEAQPHSDVDLFFDYEKGAFGLFALIEVKELANAILDSPADIMTRDSLHPVLRPRIEAEAQRIF